jgi:phage terminase small subunit
MAKKGELTAKQMAFVGEYLVDLNATKAATRAGYSAKNADKIGPELLGKTRVAEAISAAQAARAAKLEIKAEDVLRRLWLIATADPRELIEYRRTCCRHCHGEDFGYQLTQREMDKREAEARAAWEKRKNKKESDVFSFDELGGVGFVATRDPNPECPECFGAGVERAYVHDTRNLSPSAVALYAGVKTTKEGIEVKMQDQRASLVDVGKHLGLFVEKEPAAPDGNAVAAAVRDAVRAMLDADGLRDAA